MTQKQRSNDVQPDIATTKTAFLHGFALAISCAITAELVFHLYPHLTATSKDNLLLGVMWATVATVFVQHVTYSSTMQAALSRMIATCISFTVCLLYLSMFPFHIWGLALLIGLGTIITVAVKRPDDIITTGITTTVVLLVAAMSPEHRWEQPVLRLGDTIIGTAVGASAGWLEGKLLRLWDLPATKERTS